MQYATPEIDEWVRYYRENFNQQKPKVHHAVTWDTTRLLAAAIVIGGKERKTFETRWVEAQLEGAISAGTQFGEDREMDRKLLILSIEDKAIVPWIGPEDDKESGDAIALDPRVMPDDPLESDIIERLLQGRLIVTHQPTRGCRGRCRRIEQWSGLMQRRLGGRVHFGATTQISPEDLGWKCVAVNVSDIAAMGGTPTWAMLGLSIPQGTPLNWLKGFTNGLHAALSRWNIHLIGGDTTCSPGPKFLSISMGGQCENAITRCSALPGDDIWVTGMLGTAAQGFFHGGPA